MQSSRKNENNRITYCTALKFGLTSIRNKLTFRARIFCQAGFSFYSQIYSFVHPEWVWFKAKFAKETLTARRNFPFWRVSEHFENKLRIETYFLLVFLISTIAFSYFDIGQKCYGKSTTRSVFITWICHAHNLHNLVLKLRRRNNEGISSWLKCKFKNKPVTYV